MRFWMRSATLQIGGNRYGMDDLYFEFEVPFEDSDTLQTAKFSAYNLAEATRKGIKRGDVIILNAKKQAEALRRLSPFPKRSVVEKILISHGRRPWTRTATP